MGQIRVNTLRVRTIIGIHEYERKEPQEISISLSLEVDNAAELSDDLDCALDYEALCTTICEQVADTSFFLIERLAAFVMDLIMQHPRTISATVCITKPQAIQQAESVSYEIASRRH